MLQAAFIFVLLPLFSIGNYSAKNTFGLVARFTAPLLENRAHRVTSLQYSPDGDELLVSYSSELIYLFNLKVSDVHNFTHCMWVAKFGIVL